MDIGRIENCVNWERQRQTQKRGLRNENEGYETVTSWCNNFWGHV